MPFVRIDLFEGRTLEQKKALAKRLGKISKKRAIY